jgi:hypothetical protein
VGTSSVNDEVYSHFFPRTHIKKALLVLAQIEAPFWGTVQNYDGVGMSAGLIHNIAVYRNGSQGSLWGLLRDMEPSITAGDAGKALWDAFRDEGCFVSQDGKLREWNTGKLMPGKWIIDLLSGPGGHWKTAAEQARARSWALRFAAAFADPLGYTAQINSAIQWLLQGQAPAELTAYETFLGRKLKRAEDVVFSHMDANEREMATSIAMILYHCHSVNAPGKAVQVLNSVLKQPKPTPEALVRALARTNYGKWRDTTDNNNRYDKTRIAMERLGFWDPAFLRRVLPVNV